MMHSTRRPSGLTSWNRRGGALKGCLIVLGIVLLIAGVAAYFVVTNWRGWVASGMKEIATQGISESDLPEGEKPEMITHVESYTDAFEAGDVTFEQFVNAMKGLTEGPLFPVGIVYTIDEGYLKPSGLSDEEKAEGTLALQRFAMGLNEKTIDVNAIKEMAAPIGYEDTEGNYHLNVKEAVNDDMMRETIANAKAMADTAGIADESYVVDLSDELEKVLDASRSKQP